MFHFLFDEDAHMPASGRVQGHGDGGRPGFPRQCARPADGQRLPHLRQSQFPFVPIPGERGCGIGGGSAVLLGFEPWIVSRLDEEVPVRRLQMSQRLLQRDRGHFAQVGVFLGFLPVGEYPTRILVGHALMTDRPCFGAGVQRHVVHLAAAAQCAPECLFLFRRRVEAEPVCPLGCRGVHASYDTMLYRLVCSYVRQRRLISP